MVQWSCLVQKTRRSSTLFATICSCALSYITIASEEEIHHVRLSHALDADCMCQTSNPCEMRPRSHDVACNRRGRSNCQYLSALGQRAEEVQGSEEWHPEAWPILQEILCDCQDLSFLRFTHGSFLQRSTKQKRTAPFLTKVVQLPLKTKSLERTRTYSVSLNLSY